MGFKFTIQLILRLITGLTAKPSIRVDFDNRVVMTEVTLATIRNSVSTLSNFPVFAVFNAAGYFITFQHIFVRVKIFSIFQVFI